MIKRETPYLFCEALCDAIRQRLPQALASDCSFYFDYEGQMPVTTADMATVHGIVDRLLRYALRTLRAGMFLRIRVEATHDERCRVHMLLATVGADPTRRSATGAQETTREDAIDPDLALVRILCGALDGDFELLTAPDGVLAEARFDIPILEPALAAPDVQADGAGAWLVGAPRHVMKMLARRLQRLGWHVRLFDTTGQLEGALDEPEHPVPAMVIGSAHRGVAVSDANRLRTTLPSQTRIVLQTLQHMSLDGDVAAGVEVEAVPLSPRRLMHYTAVAHRQGQTASGTTQAGVLEATDDGMVLVVDDNPVNRILCEEMTRMLGYAVASVNDGESAIAWCLETSPVAVLMDLNMPGMGGLAAARELRDLQASGRLAAFAIWVVSADGATAMAMDEATPFDGSIPKPISIPVLRAALSSSTARR